MKRLFRMSAEHIRGASSSSSVSRIYADVEKIIHASIESVSPPKLVQRAMQFDKSTSALAVGNHTYSIKKNIKIVAFGKAVLGMVTAVEGLLGDHVTEGVAVVPVGALDVASRHYPHYLPRHDSQVRIYEGAAGNIPDAAAEAAAQQVLSLARSCSQQDILIALVSGGGSALLPCPVDGVTLSEKQQVIECLSKRGATIHELNTVRKVISQIKGGKLSEAAYPAKVLGLILSDVIGDPPEMIASGPTVPQEVSIKAARRIIYKFKLHEDGRVPDSVSSHLQAMQTAASEASTSQDQTAPRGNVHNFIIGNNKTASETAKQTAIGLGYATYNWSSMVEGEARVLGEMYAIISFHLHLKQRLSDSALESLSAQLRSCLEKVVQEHPQLEHDVFMLMRTVQMMEVTKKKPFCLIGAGEPTVTVTGTGKGGRNQELVLAYALKLKELRSFLSHPAGTPLSEVCDTDSLFASVGTDGQDGSCDVAGAMVDPSSLESAEGQGLDPKKSLQDNDSFGFFSQLNCGKNLIRTGLTGTNVMDFHILLLR